MGVRGRKSGAALAIVPSGGEVLLVERPDPPASLSDEAAEEWTAIWEAVPPDHFARPVYPMLEAYCLVAVTVRRIAGMVRDCEESEKENAANEYRRLLSLHREQSRALALLAMRLGMASGNKTRPTLASRARKPWERD